MNRKDLLIVTAGLILGAGLAIFVFYGLDLAKNNTSAIDQVPGVALPESAAVGAVAPIFELFNLAGENVKLIDLRGKIVVINFWATWCEPCKVEMPYFDQLYNDSESELEILAINFDEPSQQVQNYVNEYQLSFPVLLDPGGIVQDLYRVRGYPTTFVVDMEGIIQFHHIGLITEGQLDHYLSQLGVNE